jgi:type III pantothenate kinase
MSMLIAVDIGNSTIGIGLFSYQESAAPCAVMKVPSRPARTPAAYAKLITGCIRKETMLQGALRPGGVISSVVPSLRRPLITAVKEVCGKNPLVVSHAVKTGLSFAVQQPERVGADRIANAVAAVHRTGKPVAVVDFGTATTITVVGKRKRFLGGAILPGIRLMQNALYTGTAGLPRNSFVKRKKFLGTNTAAAITSGIINGSAGAVEALVKGIEKELGYKVELIVTGGNAALIAPGIRRRHRVVPELTFEGLHMIYLLNSA